MDKENQITKWKQEQYEANWVNNDYHVRRYFAYKRWYDEEWVEQIAHVCDYVDNLQMVLDGC